MNYVSQVIFFIATVLTASPAVAIQVNKCPQFLNIEIGRPKGLESYAAIAYENFFSEGKTISAKLNLVSTRSSQCEYRSVGQNEEIFSAVISGSLRNGAINEALLSIFADIKVGRSTNREIDIESAVIYSKIATLSTKGISLQEAGRLYRRGEFCSYGDCAPDYVFMGKFELLNVWVP